MCRFRHVAECQLQKNQLPMVKLGVFSEHDLLHKLVWPPTSTLSTPPPLAPLHYTHSYRQTNFPKAAAFMYTCVHIYRDIIMANVSCIFHNLIIHRIDQWKKPRYVSSSQWDWNANSSQSKGRVVTLRLTLIECERFHWQPAFLLLLISRAVASLSCNSFT